MADRLLLEAGTDAYLLEDSSGVLLNESSPTVTPLPLQVAAAASTNALLTRVPTYLGSNTYAAAVLADTPSLYWRLGASGTTDSSGNGRDGTGVGSITIGGHADSPVYAETANSTDFDGSDDFVYATYVPFAAGSTRTYTGWAWRDTDATQDALVGSDAGVVDLALGAGGADVFFTTDSFATNVNWAGAWPGNNQWVHWALVFNDGANTAALYINGALVSSQTYATANPGSGNLHVGAYATVMPWDGKMAEVAVYEYGLVLAQIANHYKIGLGRVLGPATAQTTTALVLSNPTRLGLAAATVQTTTALITRAPDHLQLAASTAQTTSALIVRAPDHLQLGVAAAQSTTALIARAPDHLQLGVAASQSTTALITRAPDHLGLQPAAATATTALALSNPTLLALGAANAVTTTALVLNAPIVTEDADLPLQGSNAGATTALGLHAPDHLQLAAAAVQATTALALSNPTLLALNGAGVQSTTALITRASDHLQLGAATATATTALSVATPEPISLPLAAAAATSTTALSVTTPGPVPLSLAPSAAVSTTALGLRAPTKLAFDPAVATAVTALALSARTHLPLGSSDAVSNSALILTAPELVLLALQAASAQAATSSIVLRTGDWSYGPYPGSTYGGGDGWTYGPHNGSTYDGDEDWTYDAELTYSYGG